MMMFDSNGSMNVNEMAEKLNISPTYFSEFYKRKRGIRIQKFKDGVRWLSINEFGRKGKNLTEIAREL